MYALHHTVRVRRGNHGIYGCTYSMVLGTYTSYQRSAAPGLRDRGVVLEQMGGSDSSRKSTLDHFLHEKQNLECCSCRGHGLGQSLESLDLG